MLPPATLTDLGITRQRLHEARKLEPLEEAVISETADGPRNASCYRTHYLAGSRARDPVCGVLVCAVAIALREFGKLSDRAIADMCAVSDMFVASMRRAINPGANELHLTTRTGRDGKEYPAHPASSPEPEAWNRTAPG